MNFKRRRKTTWSSAQYRSSEKVVDAARRAVLWVVDEHEREPMDGALYSDGGFDLASVSVGREKLSDIYHYTTGNYL